MGVTLYYKDATNLIILGKVFGYRDREMPRPHGKILNPTVMQSCYKITDIVKRVSWFKSSLLLNFNNKHTYKY